jgi:phosphoribosyl 1,2-cyclic phosphodiesterase
MKLTVINSGSAGNCYLIDDGSEALLIECGVSYSEIQKAVDFDISRIVGCLVTHEHGDHCKAAKQLEKAGCPVWTAAETAAKIGLKYNFFLTAGQVSRVGNFQVLAFDVIHDAVKPFGFLIRHPDFGTLLFATDLGYSPYRFDGLNHILIECNYNDEILQEKIRNGAISRKQLGHVIGGHLSLNTCLELLKANDLKGVRNIMLLHLSDSNSNEKDIIKTIQNDIGRPVLTARKGLEISLAHPF